MGSFCEYRITDDVKQKKQKTENNSTSKTEPKHHVSQTKEGQCAPVPAERPKLCHKQTIQYATLQYGIAPIETRRPKKVGYP